MKKSTIDGKSCPFCGGSKLSVACKTKNDYKGSFKTYSIRCNSCHARGGTISGYVKKNCDYKKDLILSTIDELQATALILWNNRN